MLAAPGYEAVSFTFLIYDQIMRFVCNTNSYMKCIDVLSAPGYEAVSFTFLIYDQIIILYVIPIPT
jgi:hypothetical protein